MATMSPGLACATKGVLKQTELWCEILIQDNISKAYSEAWGGEFCFDMYIQNWKWELKGRSSYPKGNESRKSMRFNL